MPGLIAAALFGAALIAVSSLKLSLESKSRDGERAGWTHFYLTDPVTLNSRVSEQFDGVPTRDVVAGRRMLEGLLVTNPASAERWSAMGGVLAQAGQTAKARYCFSRAEELAPHTADIFWDVANFYIRAGERGHALPYLGQILSQTSEFDSRVFDAFKGLGTGFDEIAANGGMPADLRPAAAYFRYLVGGGDLENAREAWKWMLTLAPDDVLAQQYLSFLLANGRRQEAAAVWTSQLQTREPGIGKTVFVSNGSFERVPNGTAFDWQLSPNEHTKAARDEQVARVGHSSLRITFDGTENVDYRGVSQRVFLPAGTYRFEAFLRSDGITTDKGVGLRLSDAVSFESDVLAGTTDWKKVEKTFMVGSLVNSVVIEVFRHPSLKFDNKIGGSVWIDSVSITRLR